MRTPPSSRTPSRAQRVAAATVAAAALVTTTAGCSALSSLTGEETQHFDTPAEAADASMAFQPPSGLLPDDATDISVRVDTEDPTLKAYAWASASGDLPDGCAPSAPPEGIDEFYSDGGWPREATTADGQRCQAVQVTEVDGRSYAWIAW